MPMFLQLFIINRSGGLVFNKVNDMRNFEMSNIGFPRTCLIAPQTCLQTTGYGMARHSMDFMQLCHKY